MKPALHVFIAVVLISSLNHLEAQVTSSGFFWGGGGTGLMMDGTGELSHEIISGEKSKDFEVTDDLIKMVIYETSSTFGLELEHPGWSWDSKLLYGLKPFVGYRISPQLSAMVAYNYYLNKESDYSDTWNSQYSGLQMKAESEMKYTQSTIQILGQFYPAAGRNSLTSGSAMTPFIIAGFEIVSMKAETSYKYTLSAPGFNPEVIGYATKGDDSISGFIIGGGIEIPSSPSVSFVATAMYSAAKYDDDDLLEVDEMWGFGGEGSEKIDLELGVGGFMASLSLRMYLSSGPGY